MFNSFDMWDTLVTRRYMRDEVYWRTREHKPDPWGFEFDNVIPIMENIYKVKTGDIIVSDYGDGSPQWTEFVARILDKFGLHNKTYVTPDGKFQGTIWEQLPDIPVGHTGDNYNADIASAKRAGVINTVQVSQYKFTESEQKLNDLGLRSLALLCREARLTSWSPSHRGIQLCQTNYNFPALFIASVLLQRRCPTGELLFSARDCYMWVELMQKLYNRGQYWYTSCHARIHADENYHRYIQSFDKGEGVVLVDLSGSGNSFSHLPQYPSVLMYKPLRTNEGNRIPALFQSHDAWRLEQCNRAPHRKCMGVDADLQPVWLDRHHTTPETDAVISAQVNSFRHCISLMDNYDLTQDLHAKETVYSIALDFLLHRFIKFADYVEPLRLLDIKEDAV